MTCAAGQDGDVTEHGLAPVTEAGRLHRDGLEQAADLVDDQGRQGLALDVLGDDDERLARLDDLVEQRQQVLVGRDLGVDDQDVRVVEDCFHPLRVGDEVRRDVALVEAHALGELKLEAEGVALLDGDDAFLADLVHRLGDHLADRGVAGRDGGRRSDLLLGLHVLGELGQFLAHPLDRRLDAPLERHRVGARGDVAQALADQRLRQHGGRGGAVTRDVVGLLCDFLDQLCADLLPRVLELDLLGDGHAIVGDRGGAPLLLEYHVPALRAEGYLHGVGELVHTALEAAPGVLIERDHLGCHRLQSSRDLVAFRVNRADARDGRPPGGQSLPAAGEASSPRFPPWSCHSHAESANALFSTLMGECKLGPEPRLAVPAGREGSPDLVIQGKSGKRAGSAARPDPRNAVSEHGVTRSRSGRDSSPDTGRRPRADLAARVTPEGATGNAPGTQYLEGGPWRCVTPGPPMARHPFPGTGPSTELRGRANPQPGRPPPAGLGHSA